MYRNLAFVFLALAPSVPAQQNPLREAARLDREGKCEQAEPIYKQMLAAGEPSPALLNNLGNHYLVCGQPDQAQPYFERLLATNPDHPNANLQLARLAADQKQGTKALDYLKKVQDTGPAVLLLRSEALYWAGKQDAAVAILDDLERKTGGDPRLLFTIGLTCARIGLYERAEKAFNAVLVAHPGNFDVLFNLGRAAARAGHYERARGALEAALKLRPADPDTLLELGLASTALQDYSRAVFWLAQARKAVPTRPDILLALAQAAEDAGYYGDSALAFDEYLDLRPDDDTARRDRGRVCARTESRREEGLKELVWYIKKHPEDPRAHYDLAHLTWDTAPQESLDQLATAIRLDPNFAGAHVSRAWLLQRLGRPEEALAHLETAIPLQPDSSPALDLLGLVYLDLGRPADAEQALRRALALTPDNPKVLLHLGRALMALGRQKEASEYLRKFQQVRPAQGRDFSKEAVMIELASLPPDERRKQQIERFRKLAKLRPDNADLQLHVADLLLADGRTEDAVREFRTLLKMNAAAEVRESAGKSLLRAGQYELAREFLERASAGRPDARLDLAIATFYTKGPEPALDIIDNAMAGEQRGDYLLLKAQILDAAGRPDEAEAALDQGLQHAATRPGVARQAALLLVRHERYTDALDLLTRTAGAAPASPDLLLTKAIILALAGQPAAAESELQRIEARWPEWDRPYLAHGLLLASQDRSADARSKLQTAIALAPSSPTPKCTLAHLNGAPPDNSPCPCPTSLHDLLFPQCK